MVEPGVAFAHLAVDDTTGEVVGYTLWCLVYSTWRGTAIHVDDIYVRQDAVGRGVDRALLHTLAALCAERGYRHMQWWGRVTNEPTAAFYRSLGAEIPSVQGKELTIFRLSGAPWRTSPARSDPAIDHGAGAPARAGVIPPTGTVQCITGAIRTLEMHCAGPMVNNGGRGGEYSPATKSSARTSADPGDTPRLRRSPTRHRAGGGRDLRQSPQSASTHPGLSLGVRCARRCVSAGGWN
ncbi:GNAT family N-acetyltransferase [Micromonospora sp. R77]|uniref:GNAT family N-acetyltransferase n=1 Tax=Micromonospora sp. R77 TaxID=2925836 RepID=UPI001F61D8B4|nr:GNAT family N-acetyltransferase [Micromonospora sp. R77]MCI4061679.1 GNAT family N-acetyltransferase [Micromonospora sp. R77]